MDDVIMTASNPTYLQRSSETLRSILLYFRFSLQIYFWCIRAGRKIQWRRTVVASRDVAIVDCNSTRYQVLVCTSHVSYW